MEPRMSRDCEPAPDGSELGWRLVTPGWARAAALASTSPGSIRRHRGQAGDGGAGARYQPRTPGPGHTRKNLCVPWCSSRVRVTSVGLFWAGAGQRGEVARLQWSRVILDNYLGSGHWSQGLSNTWRDQTGNWPIVQCWCCPMSA